MTEPIRSLKEQIVDADAKQAELLSVLAAIVNRASRAKQTTSTEWFECAVPLNLLTQAKTLLAYYADTEFGTDAVKHAKSRSFR